MASYGNAKDRISEGIFSYLYLNVIAIDDGLVVHDGNGWVL